MTHALSRGYLVVITLTLCLIGMPGQAAVSVASIFTDHMVLQRNAAVPIWGTATPGEAISVTFQTQKLTTTANATGAWSVRLKSMPAGGPYTLTVTDAHGGTTTLSDVLCGDVWICSGQSNMAMGIGAVQNGAEEIANANYPQIRLFTVPNRIALSPQTTIDGAKWSVCSPETVGAGGWGGFSAVGYFFGRHLYQTQKVPIGLIHTSWSGTVAEAWASTEALQTMPEFLPAIAQVQQLSTEQGNAEANYQRLMAEWWQANDPGSAGTLGWADPAFAPTAWQTMTLPQNWENAGLTNFDGIVWFRKEIDLPQAWAGKACRLSLGPIDDRDTTWVNGVKVGEMNDWNVPREYIVPATTLKAGRNVLAIRVLDTGGGGGVFGTPQQLMLTCVDDPQLAPITLAGEWQYALGASLDKTSPYPQRVDNNPNAATVLYNGMIAPLVPFAIKGAIWYQGESNAGRAEQYRTLLPVMIQDWRSRFGVGNFPFFIVQLANFMQKTPPPVDSDWAELREAQALTAKTFPKTGMAVTIDIGDTNDIHPKDKQDVGKRLGLAAQAIAYGEKIEYSGPTYRTLKIEAPTIRLYFDHLGGGLVAKDGAALLGFAIAGEDKQFVWADAKIDGNTILVSSPQVAEPVAVRYAWANNPDCNLYNAAGLPASPFRTDTWPGITTGKK